MTPKKKNAGKKVSTRKAGGKNWVIGIDPFSDLDLSPIWNFVKPQAAKLGVSLHAVYVLSPSSLNWTGEFSGPWLKRYQPLSQAKMDEVVRDESIKKMVVPCKETGLWATVKALLAYATKVKASGIVVSTHARHGLERWALGSFAETLILISKIPVWVVNPGETVPTSVRKMVVPLDLSKASQRFAKSLADYAKKWNSEIVLYYKQPDPLDPIIQQGVYSLGGGWVSVQNFLEAEVAQHAQQIEKIESDLKKVHVKVSHVFDTQPGGVIEGIEQAARDSGADLIAVRTESGPWSAALLGSVARGLVRSSEVPLLIER